MAPLPDEPRIASFERAEEPLHGVVRVPEEAGEEYDVCGVDLLEEDGSFEGDHGISGGAARGCSMRSAAVDQGVDMSSASAASPIA